MASANDLVTARTGYDYDSIAKAVWGRMSH
jgi:hypothetical protein